MSRPRPLLVLLAALATAAVARPLSACMIVGPAVVRVPEETLLMAVPTADSVYVGRAGRLDGVRLGAWLHARDFARKSGAWQRVHGQRVRVVRVAWNLGDSGSVSGQAQARRSWSPGAWARTAARWRGGTGRCGCGPAGAPC